jgi:hypothetical protein
VAALELRLGARVVDAHQERALAAAHRCRSRRLGSVRGRRCGARRSRIAGGAVERGAGFVGPGKWSGLSGGVLVGRWSRPRRSGSWGLGIGAGGTRARVAKFCRVHWSVDYRQRPAAVSASRILNF